MAQLNKGVNLFKQGMPGPTGKIVLTNTAPTIDEFNGSTETHFVHKADDATGVFIYTGFDLVVYKSSDGVTWSEYGVIADVTRAEAHIVPWEDGIQYLHFVTGNALETNAEIRLVETFGPILIDSTPEDMDEVADSLKSGDVVAQIPVQGGVGGVGAKGEDGASALDIYRIAVGDPNVTQAEFIVALTGKSAFESWKDTAPDGEDRSEATEADFIASIGSGSRPKQLFAEEDGDNLPAFEVTVDETTGKKAFVPTEDQVFDLGSDGAYFKGLYLLDQTIHFANQTNLGVSDDGALQVDRTVPGIPNNLLNAITNSGDTLQEALAKVGASSSVSLSHNQIQLLMNIYGVNSTEQVQQSANTVITPLDEANLINGEFTTPHEGALGTSDNALYSWNSEQCAWIHVGMPADGVEEKIQMHYLIESADGQTTVQTHLNVAGLAPIGGAVKANNDTCWKVIGFEIGGIQNSLPKQITDFTTGYDTCEECTQSLVRQTVIADGLYTNPAAVEKAIAKKEGQFAAAETAFEDAMVELNNFTRFVSTFQGRNPDAAVPEKYETRLVLLQTALDTAKAELTEVGNEIEALNLTLQNLLNSNDNAVNEMEGTIIEFSDSGESLYFSLPPMRDLKLSYSSRPAKWRDVEDIFIDKSYTFQIEVEKELKCLQINNILTQKPEDGKVNTLTAGMIKNMVVFDGNEVYSCEERIEEEAVRASLDEVNKEWLREIKMIRSEMEFYAINSKTAKDNTFSAGTIFDGFASDDDTLTGLWYVLKGVADELEFIEPKYTAREGSPIFQTNSAAWSTLLNNSYQTVTGETLTLESFTLDPNFSSAISLPAYFSLNALNLVALEKHCQLEGKWLESRMQQMEENGETEEEFALPYAYLKRMKKCVELLFSNGMEMPASSTGKLPYIDTPNKDTLHSLSQINQDITTSLVNGFLKDLTELPDVLKNVTETWSTMLTTMNGEIELIENDLGIAEANEAAKQEAYDTLNADKGSTTEQLQMADEALSQAIDEVTNLTEELNTKKEEREEQISTKGYVNQLCTKYLVNATTTADAASAYIKDFGSAMDNANIADWNAIVSDFENAVQETLPPIEAEWSARKAFFQPQLDSLTTKIDTITEEQDSNTDRINEIDAREKEVKQKINELEKQMEKLKSDKENLPLNTGNALVALMIQLRGLEGYQVPVYPEGHKGAGAAMNDHDAAMAFKTSLALNDGSEEYLTALNFYNQLNIVVPPEPNEFEEEMEGELFHGVAEKNFVGFGHFTGTDAEGAGEEPAGEEPAGEPGEEPVGKEVMVNMSNVEIMKKLAEISRYHNERWVGPPPANVTPESEYHSEKWETFLNTFLSVDDTGVVELMMEGDDETDPTWRVNVNGDGDEWPPSITIGPGSFDGIGKLDIEHEQTIEGPGREVDRFYFLKANGEKAAEIPMGEELGSLSNKLVSAYKAAGYTSTKTESLEPGFRTVNVFDTWNELQTQMDTGSLDLEMQSNERESYILNKEINKLAIEKATLNSANATLKRDADKLNAQRDGLTIQFQNFKTELNAEWTEAWNSLKMTSDIIFNKKKGDMVRAILAQWSPQGSLGTGLLSENENTLSDHLKNAVEWAFSALDNTFSKKMYDNLQLVLEGLEEMSAEDADVEFKKLKDAAKDLNGLYEELRSNSSIDFGIYGTEPKFDSDASGPTLRNLEDLYPMLDSRQFSLSGHSGDMSSIVKIIKQIITTIFRTPAGISHDGYTVKKSKDPILNWESHYSFLAILLYRSRLKNIYNPINERTEGPVFGSINEDFLTLREQLEELFSKYDERRAILERIEDVSPNFSSGSKMGLPDSKEADVPVAKKVIDDSKDAYTAETISPPAEKMAIDGENTSLSDLIPLVQDLAQIDMDISMIKIAIQTKIDDAQAALDSSPIFGNKSAFMHTLNAYLQDIDVYPAHRVLSYEPLFLEKLHAELHRLEDQYTLSLGDISQVGDTEMDILVHNDKVKDAILRLKSLYNSLEAIITEKDKFNEEYPAAIKASITALNNRISDLTLAVEAAAIKLQQSIARNEVLPDLIENQTTISTNAQNAVEANSEARENHKTAIKSIQEVLDTIERGTTTWRWEIGIESVEEYDLAGLLAIANNATQSEVEAELNILIANQLTLGEQTAALVTAAENASEELQNLIDESVALSEGLESIDNQRGRLQVMEGLLQNSSDEKLAMKCKENCVEETIWHTFTAKMEADIAKCMAEEEVAAEEMEEAASEIEAVDSAMDEAEELKSTTESNIETLSEELDATTGEMSEEAGAVVYEEGGYTKVVYKDDAAVSDEAKDQVTTTVDAINNEKDKVEETNEELKDLEEKAELAAIKFEGRKNKYELCQKIIAQFNALKNSLIETLGLEFTTEEAFDEEVRLLKANMFKAEVYPQEGGFGNNAIQTLTEYDGNRIDELLDNGEYMTLIKAVGDTLLFGGESAVSPFSLLDGVDKDDVVNSTQKFEAAFDKIWNHFSESTNSEVATEVVKTAMKSKFKSEAGEFFDKIENPLLITGLNAEKLNSANLLEEFVEGLNVALKQYDNMLNSLFDPKLIEGSNYPEILKDTESETYTITYKIGDTTYSSFEEWLAADYVDALVEGMFTRELQNSLRSRFNAMQKTVENVNAIEVLKAATGQTTPLKVEVCNNFSSWAVVEFKYNYARPNRETVANANNYDWTKSSDDAAKVVWGDDNTGVLVSSHYYANEKSVMSFTNGNHSNAFTQIILQPGKKTEVDIWGRMPEMYVVEISENVIKTGSVDLKIKDFGDYKHKTLVSGTLSGKRDGYDAFNYYIDGSTGLQHEHSLQSICVDDNAGVPNLEDCKLIQSPFYGMKYYDGMSNWDMSKVEDVKDLFKGYNFYVPTDYNPNTLDKDYDYETGVFPMLSADVLSYYSFNDLRSWNFNSLTSLRGMMFNQYLGGQEQFDTQVGYWLMPNLIEIVDFFGSTMNSAAIVWEGEIKNLTPNTTNPDLIFKNLMFANSPLNIVAGLPFDDNGERLVEESMGEWLKGTYGEIELETSTDERKPGQYLIPTMEFELAKLGWKCMPGKYLEENQGLGTFGENTFNAIEGDYDGTLIKVFNPKDEPCPEPYERMGADDEVQNIGEPPATDTINGNVKASIVSGATINALDKNNNVIASTNTDAIGDFTFIKLAIDQLDKIEAIGGRDGVTQTDNTIHLTLNAELLRENLDYSKTGGNYDADMNIATTMASTFMNDGDTVQEATEKTNSMIGLISGTAVNAFVPNHELTAQASANLAVIKATTMLASGMVQDSESAEDVNPLTEVIKEMKKIYGNGTGEVFNMVEVAVNSTNEMLDNELAELERTALTNALYGVLDITVDVNANFDQHNAVEATLTQSAKTYGNDAAEFLNAIVEGEANLEDATSQLETTLGETKQTLSDNSARDNALYAHQSFMSGYTPTQTLEDMLVVEKHWPLTLNVNDAKAYGTMRPDLTFYHTHVLGGITYFMPNGTLDVDNFHGNYVAPVTGYITHEMNEALGIDAKAMKLKEFHSTLQNSFFNNDWSILNENYDQGKEILLTKLTELFTQLESNKSTFQLSNGKLHFRNDNYWQRYRDLNGVDRYILQTFGEIFGEVYDRYAGILLNIENYWHESSISILQNRVEEHLEGRNNSIASMNGNYGNNPDSWAVGTHSHFNSEEQVMERKSYRYRDDAQIFVLNYITEKLKAQKTLIEKESNYKMVDIENLKVTDISLLDGYATIEFNTPELFDEYKTLTEDSIEQYKKDNEGKFLIDLSKYDDDSGKFRIPYNTKCEELESSDRVGGVGLKCANTESYSIVYPVVQAFENEGQAGYNLRMLKGEASNNYYSNNYKAWKKDSQEWTTWVTEANFTSDFGFKGVILLGENDAARQLHYRMEAWYYRGGDTPYLDFWRSGGTNIPEYEAGFGQRPMVWTVNNYDMTTQDDVKYSALQLKRKYGESDTGIYLEDQRALVIGEPQQVSRWYSSIDKKDNNLDTSLFNEKFEKALYHKMAVSGRMEIFIKNEEKETFEIYSGKAYQTPRVRFENWRPGMVNNIIQARQIFVIEGYPLYSTNSYEKRRNLHITYTSSYDDCNLENRSFTNIFELYNIYEWQTTAPINPLFFGWNAQLFVPKEYNGLEIQSWNANEPVVINDHTNNHIQKGFWDALGGEFIWTNGVNGGRGHYFIKPEIDFEQKLIKFYIMGSGRMTDHSRSYVGHGIEGQWSTDRQEAVLCQDNDKDGIQARFDANDNSFGSINSDFDFDNDGIADSEDLFIFNQNPVYSILKKEDGSKVYLRMDLRDFGQNVDDDVSFVNWPREEGGDSKPTLVKFTFERVTEMQPDYEVTHFEMGEGTEMITDADHLEKVQFEIDNWEEGGKGFA